MNPEAEAMRQSDPVRREMNNFRSSMNDWIIFLNSELKKTRKEILALRQKVNQLEVNRHRLP